MDPAQQHVSKEAAERLQCEPLLRELALRMQREQEEQLKFESFLSELSVRFINLPAQQVDGAIEDAQRLFCEALGLERSTLYQYFEASPGALLLTHLCECGETCIVSGIVERRSDPKLLSSVYWVQTDTTEPATYRRVDVESFWPWVFRRLQRGEPLIMSNLDELPEDAAQDREMFRRYGTKSTVIMPMTSGGTRIGCITFATLRATREWSEVELKRFRFIADIFANALVRKRAEEGLQKSEERFRQIAETVGDFIWEVDADGLYTYTSPSVEKILGYSPAELIGKVHFYDLFAPAVRQQLKAAALKAFAARQAFRGFPNANLAKDGRIAQLETSGVPVLDETGNLSGYRGSDTDVTDRLKAHEELRQSEQKFRALHESMRDAFARTDLSGRIQEFNSAFQQMMGYSEAELHCLRYTEITPERWHELEKEINHSQVLARGYSDVYEKEYRRKDGTVFPVELRTFLIRDETNQPAGMWAIVRDITERKRADQIVKESEERFRTLIEHAGDGVEVVDQAGTHIDVNPARLRQLGYTREEMLRLSIFDINPFLDQEQFKRSSQLVAAGSVLRLETVNRRKDGSTFPVEVTVSPIKLAGRSCALALVRDVTERHQAEASLRQNEERLRLILEANSEGVWDWNIPTGQAYFSPHYAGMLGYEPQEFAKSYAAWKELVHPDDFERVHRAHGEHIHQGKEFCVEFRMKKKTGDWCWIRSRGTVVERDSEGRAVRMVGTHLEVTDRKRTEQALLESGERLRIAA